MIVLDIETVPLAASMAEPYPEADRSPPSTWKDEAKIAAWYADDRQKWEEDRIKAYSLSARLGRVVAVGVRFPGGDTDTDIAKSEANEAGTLANLWSWIKEHRQVAGFNSLGFDLPFLLTRSLILGVSVPVYAPAYLRRYSHDPHFDVRMALTNWDVRQPGTLDDWCQAFGIAGKTGHGSEVYGQVTAGRWDDLARYLEADVQATGQLVDRIGPAFGVQP